MSSKSRASQTNSNIKSYEECLKKGIPLGKIYGSDFTNDSSIKRYTYPPYPWNMNLFSSDSKKKARQGNRQKSIRTSQKKIKVKSRSRKIKSKSKSKSKPKKKQQQQRFKSRKR